MEALEQEMRGPHLPQPLGTWNWGRRFLRDAVLGERKHTTRSDHSEHERSAYDPHAARAAELPLPQAPHPLSIRSGQSPQGAQLC